MIDLSTAAELLDFGASIGQGPRAEEQLRGAVAVHNILDKQGVAYLADEVGMGKTYVALGALALFRHFNPEFRVLVIAPKENIQFKWIKEFRNFVGHNLRFPDLRVAAVDGRPARPLVPCHDLVGFVREAVADADRDFFLRLSSFSLGLSDTQDRQAWHRVRNSLLESLPWLPDEALSLRCSKEEFKDSVARAVCCATPPFDLVIIDEGHNLKHGFKPGVAARNRVLALALGHRDGRADRRLFPGYGQRAQRVLFLSATPLEESYEHIWNQLQVCGREEAFMGLCGRTLPEEGKKALASGFLVRRVTSMQVAGRELTKNQYRREWRSGGVMHHDEPIAVTDVRQRLTVALVQKKVAELLGSEKFKMSFQVGMLASFESFLETTKLKRSDEENATNFDDAEQTEEIEDDTLRRELREGMDVRDVNRMARDYRQRFGEELPHPKMDALVASLKDAWVTGRKALVFVRRVRSVDELKRKLDQRYDDWLIGLLQRELPVGAQERFARIVAQYRQEKGEVAAVRARRLTEPATDGVEEDADDHGGTDTFFAWFFRGTGPKGVISGANIQGRFIQQGTAYATFFEDNHVAALLGVSPADAIRALSEALGLGEEALSQRLRERAVRYLGRARRHPRGERFEAAQGAAFELLRELQSPLGLRAGEIWHERFEGSVRQRPATTAPDVLDQLTTATFLTELREPRWAALRAAIWPEPQGRDAQAWFKEQELRGQLLATAARLGHALIDLYLLTIRRLGSIDLRTLESEGEGSEALNRVRITDYLERLEWQRTTPVGDRWWGAFDELQEIGSNFELILAVNAPAARTEPLAQAARGFGALLRQQQPVGGMWGQINKTLVQQFRMPGYPFVLLTTDLLQEGEDLHTFCSSVHHYGIAWTPSAMEQRVGRIDRVRSQTDRRLTGSSNEPSGGELLQVHYPHLQDTVEVLQVQRVFDRMNTFLRLMHEDLAVPKAEHRSIDVARELTLGRRRIEVVKETLRTAFPVPEWALRAPARKLATDAGHAIMVLERFNRLRESQHPSLEIHWEPITGKGRLLGTVRLSGGRQQPFTLLLKSLGENLVVRCISPVGLVGVDELAEELQVSARLRQVRLGGLPGRGEGTYDLTVEEDVLLGAPEADGARVGALLERVAVEADELEQQYLHPLDQPLQRFERDLRREGATDAG